MPANFPRPARRTSRVPASLVGVLVCAAVGLSSLLSRPADAQGVDASITPYILHARTPSPARRMRADFEPIDVLALVHTHDWERSLRHIIRVVSGAVDVHVLSADDDPETRRFVRWARRRGARVTRVPHDSPWIRDYGPLQVFEGAVPVWVDYHYSDERRLDDELPTALAASHGATLDAETTSLDGGGIVSDGRGLCVITQYTLQDTGLDLDDVDATAVFIERLGCRLLTVVPQLDTEETGHVDLAVQFLAADRVAIARMDPQRFPQQAAALDATADAVAAAARLLGRPMHIVRVPMRARGTVFFSYLNGTRVGDIFLVPSYTRVPRTEERTVYALLSAHLPGVRVVPVAADAMARLGGAIHCITVGLNLYPRKHPSLPARRRLRRPAPRRPVLRRG